MRLMAQSLPCVANGQCAEVGSLPKLAVLPIQSGGIGWVTAETVSTEQNPTTASKVRYGKVAMSMPSSYIRKQPSLFTNQQLHSGMRPNLGTTQPVETEKMFRTKQVSAGRLNKEAWPNVQFNPGRSAEGVCVEALPPASRFGTTDLVEQRAAINEALRHF